MLKKKRFRSKMLRAAKSKTEHEKKQFVRKIAKAVAKADRPRPSKK